MTTAAPEQKFNAEEWSARYDARLKEIIADRESGKLPRFEVTKIKSFRGMEGNGFNATITLNGKAIGLAIDDASGGGVQIKWNDQAEGNKLEKAYNGDGPAQDRAMGFDTFLEELVNLEADKKFEQKNADKWAKAGFGFTISFKRNGALDLSAHRTKEAAIAHAEKKGSTNWHFVKPSVEVADADALEAKRVQDWKKGAIATQTAAGFKTIVFYKKAGKTTTSAMSFKGDKAVAEKWLEENKIKDFELVTL